MSLKTWRAEFYPKRPNKKMTAREAVEHSLLKWQGLFYHNLEKHEVESDSLGIHAKGKDNPFFNVDASTCALCVKYIYDDSGFREGCKECPLGKTLGKPCDRGVHSPYRMWIEKASPVAMYMALSKTLENIDSL